MSDPLISSVRRICISAVDEGAVTVETRAGAVRIHAGSWAAQQQLRQVLHRTGWQVHQGHHHTLVVRGWSPTALQDRIRLLELLSLALRDSYQLTVHNVIDLVDHHLQVHPGASEAEVVTLACDSADRQAPWTQVLDDVEHLPRRCGDPLLATLMTAVLKAETELAQWHAEHQMAARRAAEVLWRCRHSRISALTPSTARMVAWQEAMRLVSGDDDTGLAMSA
ncbi:hypothetical protein OG339_48535 (plasmid) [Streptosporangium sp. NBC_01495]|uniref:hypothetical protein n=1 Tax=Streptosporangium sp. NBC_01495 TaxID=2903899 RepID=UPI002E2F2F91|nr:hypothetical protein [Streptosporangium sp. NBC_01495]